MNKDLLKEVIHHVMASFGVIQSSFIDPKKTGSLLDPAYILPEKIRFEVDENLFENNIWGCQISALQNEVRVLLSKLGDENQYDFVMAVQSKGAPTYGLVLSYELEHGLEHCMLAVSIDGKTWMDCSTFLQATFLAAMEQVKDLGSGWQACSDYEELHSSLISFIKFYDDQFECNE